MAKGVSETVKHMQREVDRALGEKSPVVVLNTHFLKAVAIAASRDGMRAYLCAVYVEVDSKGMTVTATDGHQLISIRDDTYPPDDVDEPFTMLIPLKVVSELDGLLLRKSKENGLFSTHVKAQRVGKEIVFTSLAGGEQTRLSQIVCHEINGTYPDYRRVIPNARRLSEGTPAQLVSFNWQLCANIQDAAGIYRWGGKLLGSCPMNFGGEAEPALFTLDGGKFIGVVMPMRCDESGRALKGINPDEENHDEEGDEG